MWFELEFEEDGKYLSMEPTGIGYTVQKTDTVGIFVPTSDKMGISIDKDGIRVESRWYAIYINGKLDFAYLPPNFLLPAFKPYDDLCPDLPEQIIP